nr:MAG: amidase [Sphaerobacter thermophilus]
MNDLVRRTAVEVVELLARREITPLELIDAALERIAETDGQLNALPTLAVERARAQAARLAAEAPAPGTPAALLRGLPIAVKDITDVAGVRTTYGSPIFADHVPERSDIMVEMLEARGAIVLAKSNIPELAAGGTTFNEVFGKTRNPWNTRLTPGGSSGGSAAALAAGQVWLATGTDLGGSLRIPASFCGVVGLRPSPGRVASGPRPLPFDTLTVSGPMGRTVADVALMLDAMAGEHPEDPLSLPAPAVPFLEAARRPALPARIAYSDDLGLTPVDREVAAVCRRAALSLERLGARVEEAHPDLSDADQIFKVLRAFLFAAQRAPLLEKHRDQLKPEVIWNIEQGLRLTADDLARAEADRGALFARAAEFFSRYDLLLCPTVITPPFDVDQRYLTEIEGVELKTYVDWLILTSATTLLGHPILSIPCGFTASGLPVGLQVIGRYHGEAELLRAAAAMEEVFGIAGQLPIDPR